MMPYNCTTEISGGTRGSPSSNCLKKNYAVNEPSLAACSDVAVFVCKGGWMSFLCLMYDLSYLRCFFSSRVRTYVLIYFIM